jgi:hypothetical protein
MSYPVVTAKVNNAAFNVSANQWNAVANSVNAPTRPYDYLVYNNAGSYEVYDKYGKIVSAWTSAVAQTAINAPIASLATAGKGGTVQLMGNFPLSGSVILYQNITLQGQGIIERTPTDLTYSELVLPSGATYPAVKMLYDPDSPAPPNKSFARVRELVIIGANTSVYSGQDGIKVDDTGGAIYDAFIDNVGVFYVADNGVYSPSVAKLWITNSYFEHQTNGAGIKQTAGTIHAENNYIYDNKYGVYSYSGASLQLLANNISANTYNGLYLRGNTASCIITDNYFINNGTNSYANVHFLGASGTTNYVATTFANNQLIDTRAKLSAAKYGVFVDGGQGRLPGTCYGNVFHATNGWGSDLGIKYNTYDTTILKAEVMTSRGNINAGLGGIVANPLKGVNLYIIAQGGDSATWVTTSTYTNIETAKDFYVVSGTITDLKINGTSIPTTITSFHLEPGDTFTPAFSDALVMIVNSWQ